MSVAIPRYAELPFFEKTGVHHAWGIFGKEDQLGRINLLTPNVVRAAAAEVVSGEVFNLSLPLTMPDRPEFGSEGPGRKQFRHTILTSRIGQDDFLDGFYLQGSTQWDSLRHVRYREFGYYNGHTDQAETGDKLGIENWAEHGIVGRGVVVDVARYFESLGRPMSPIEDYAITVADLVSTLEYQEARLRPGDILMLRTGYVEAYRSSSESERGKLDARPAMPGLHAGEATAEFLWDSGVVGIVADNIAVENVPGSPQVGFLHRHLIPLLGFAVGEYFDLESISAASAKDRRYGCMFASAPLNLPGGVGSPGNALAMR